MDGRIPWRIAVVSSVVVALSSSAAARLLPHGVGSRALDDTLRRAGDWVERFADESVSIVGSEEYVQEYRRGVGPNASVERRTLLSEVALLETLEGERRAGYPWVQFRDVLEVDGQRLPDRRGRLERLFGQMSASAYAEGAAISAESARYNIGPGPRTVNVPLFALFFLVPQNQGRFRFESRGADTLGGTRVAVVGYREREKPTMIRSPERADRPARGSFWIDASGRVLRSRLDVDSDHRWTMETDVVFGWDAHVEAWVPLTMHERHHRGEEESLDCTARYFDYRRFSTGARIIGRW